MHSSGDSQPKKGAGYFANRLKEKTGEESKEEAKATPEASAPAPQEIQDKVSPDATATAPKVGQIFEETTKSIAAMTDDMSETAKMVSSMKEGLERVAKIKDLLTSNPLCDDSGSCTFDGVNFAPQSQENEEKIANMITKYAQSNITDLQSDADSIREELQQFKNTIKQKESQIAQFREKLNEVRQQANSSGDSTLQLSTLSEPAMSEFDAATSDQDLVSFNSIQTQDLGGLVQIQQQELKDGEKKLLELRWKIKKAELEYEQKTLQTSQIEDLTTQVKSLESKKQALQLEVKNLENQNKEPKLELKELE